MPFDDCNDDDNGYQANALDRIKGYRITVEADGSWNMNLPLMLDDLMMLYAMGGFSKERIMAECSARFDAAVRRAREIQ